MDRFKSLPGPLLYCADAPKNRFAPPELPLVQIKTGEFVPGGGGGDMRERNGLPQMSIHFLDTLSMRPPPVEMASEMKSHSWGTPKG